MDVRVIYYLLFIDKELDGQRWHFGLFLQQQWLHDQGQDIINQLQTLRQGIHSP